MSDEPRPLLRAEDVIMCRGNLFHPHSAEFYAGLDDLADRLEEILELFGEEDVARLEEVWWGHSIADRLSRLIQR